jgi:oligopeptide/dipeptide ABC transporter ATP-binding protein
LICDEAVSSLDVSVQGQIVNLLSDLQLELGMAMLFISHNLAVVRHLSHRVLVIYRGRLVETAPCDALFAAPAHPYTRALLAAVPHLHAGAQLPATVGDDVLPEETRAGGCPYQGRCPLVADICRESAPELEEVVPGHVAACHRRHDVVYSKIP